MLKVNVNNKCRVKLTETGKAIIDKQSNWLKFYKYDENGYYTTELWEIMNLFGSYLNNGQMNIPFETDIEIENK